MVEQVAPNDENALNREELLQLGIRTAKSGNAPGARVMFQKILDEDPRNERALLWMAYLAESAKEKRRYLTLTLKVNPDNATARRELDRMARAQEAGTNRTLLYGGIFIGVLLLLAVLVCVFLFVVLPAL